MPITSLDGFEILPVLGLKDSLNTYGWLMHDVAANQTLLVDAPEYGPLRAALNSQGWRLDAIWLTHHHDDHIAAAPALAAEFGCPILGPRSEAHRLPPLDQAVSPEDVVTFGTTSGRAIDVPGHARGQLAYYFSKPGTVFCADSLMSLGCGRLMEGSAEEMWRGLSQLKALPAETLVASGHEIAKSNGSFAKHVDPHNRDLTARLAEIDRLCSEGLPTVPVSLDMECRTNPFLRVDDPSFRTHLSREYSAPHTILAELRAQKDSW